MAFIINIMKKLFSYIIFPVFIASCSGGNGNNSDFIPAQPSVVPEKTDSIETWKADDSVSAKDFIDEQTDECKYVFLQADKANSMIGCINQIFVDDSTFTIIDNSITERIFRFDRNGKYIGAIGSKGKARGEYIGLGCASKTDNGNLAITDRLSKKLIIYSTDGNVVEEYTMNKAMPLSMVMTDSIVLGSFPGYHKSLKYRLKWFDLKGKDIHTAFPFTSTRRYVAGKLLKDKDRNIYYNYDLNDTIFRIENYRITPEIVMNIHDSKLTNEFIKETESLDKKDYNKKLYTNEDIVNQVDLIKCDDKWVVYYQKGTNAYNSFISENGMSRVNYRRAKVSHTTRDAELVIPEKFVDYADGYLIGYIDPEAFAYLDDSRKSKYLNRIRQNSVNAPDNDEDIESYGNASMLSDAKKP